jgi:hypothetical protein
VFASPLPTLGPQSREPCLAPSFKSCNITLGWVPQLGRLSSYFVSHGCRNKGERVRVHKRTLSDPEGAAGTTKVVNGVELVHGVTELTRALGFASCKQRQGEQASGMVQG